MPVVGKHCYVISKTGRRASVSPYSPDYAAKTIPIVDAAVLYEDKTNGKEYVLVLRNALHVPSMQHNLLPPFILRENGIQVFDTPKIHVGEPSENDHVIKVDEHLKIPLSLYGTFSYFETRKPTLQQLNESDDVYLLTPEEFNPHSAAFAQNEDHLVDHEGQMRDPRDVDKLLLADVEEDPTFHVCAMSTSGPKEQHPCTLLDPLDEDFSGANVDVSTISGVLDPHTLASRLSIRREVSSMMISLGASAADPVRESVFFDDEEFDGVQDQAEEDSIEDKMTYLTDRIEDGMDIDEFMVASTYAKPSQGVHAAHLAKIWKLDYQTAERTVQATTQRRRHSHDPKLARNYGTNDRMLRYKRINQHFYMDTFFATKKGGTSSRGNTCCQLFVTDKGFVFVVPMRTKADVLQAVKQFAKEVGAPDAIVCDAAREQMSASLRKFMSSIGSTLKILEQGTPWTNRAELYVGLMKAAVRRDMRTSNCPLVFWDYCVERRARINNATAKNLFQLHGTTPHESVTGEPADISNLCMFDFYDWCYAMDQERAFPSDKLILGRCLGPAKGEGNEMCQWVLKANGRVVSRRTVRPLTPQEIHSPEEQEKRRLFDDLIRRIKGSPLGAKGSSSEEEEDEDSEWQPYSDEDEFARPIPDMEDTVDARGRIINQQPAYDRLINAEIRHQLDGGEEATGRVIRRVVAPDGSQIGTYDHNPAMNTMRYEVEFNDGQIKEYGATTIAENLLSQVDSDGFSNTMFSGIVDYKKDPKVALSEEQAYVTSHSGKRRLRKTTRGWKLMVRWTDGSQSLIDLAVLKESNPVDVAEFAKAVGIDKEPAFRWWVPYTLRKRDTIISAVKARVRKVTHKYGIELPTSVEHAKRLDAMNGNSLWMDALSKEMRNIGLAMEVLDYGIQPPPGYSKVTGHLIWDVKMDFTRKARWVLDGHKTPNPLYSQYAGVVSRESVRIAFVYAALNDLNVCAADIRNAYLQAPSSRKDYIICGPEFGLENVGKVALVHRALYGGKTAGRDFRNHLRACMHHMDFVSCPADPDVWMRPAMKADGSEYWEYILLYTDDALCVSENPETTLRNQLGKYFELKEESIGPPKIYLGSSVRKVELDTGVKCWTLGSSQYVQAAVKNVEKNLQDRRVAGDERFRLRARAMTPMQTSYRPELDVSPVLSTQDAAYYQSLIGILRWIVELGRVDICLECSLMSSQLAMPRVGHMHQVMHIFSYLKSHHNAELILDPTYPEIDTASFDRRDWSTSEFGHLDLKEELPPNQPVPRGRGMVVVAKVDADHASDIVTRRSRTGYFIYVNESLVGWMAKKQTSVETSSFGSEFCAMKLCCECIRGLRYKLRMMGIPVLGPAFIYGDNQSVLANTSIPDSQLKKKSQSIAYHFVREGVAKDEWRTAYINTNDNESDLLTKLLPYGVKRKKFVSRLLRWVY